MSWNGEIAVSMVWGKYHVFIMLVDYSILLTDYYKTVKYSSLIMLLLKTSKGDNFLRS